MSEIKVGDLVVVVRACCPQKYAESGGWIFTVAHIRPSYTGIWRCSTCGIEGSEMRAESNTQSYKGSECAPLSWLRRIDPLQEPETIEREVETT